MMCHFIQKGFIILLSSLLLQGCFFQNKNQTIRHEDTRFMMDTIVSITTTGKDEKTLTEATNKAFTLFQEIADETDSYHSHTDDSLFAINAKAGQGPQKAAPYLFDILQQVLPMRHEQLCLTLGPVISIWNKHREAHTVPSKEEIAAALKESGDNRITLSSEKGTIALAPHSQIDLGAVAKGYAVEKAAHVLEEDPAIKTALINAGGNIKVIGDKEDGSPWRIGIQDPQDSQKLLGTLSVPSGTAIATSGDYQRYYEINGTRYHHILDPATGWPARHAHSVTVVTHSAFMADYYSTLLFVMTSEKAIELAEATPDLEVVYQDTAGRLHISSGLKNRFTKN
jgi:thiamine biosynthesis lipoprotein